MRLTNLLKTGSCAVLAAVMTLTALPAHAAQDGPASWRDANPQRAQQSRGEQPRGYNAGVAQQRQQARQAERSNGRQAQRVERRATERSADRGNSGPVIRAEGRSERRGAQGRQDAQRNPGWDRNRDANRRGVTYNSQSGRDATREGRNVVGRTDNRSWDRNRDRDERTWDRDRGNRNWDRNRQRDDRSWDRNREDNRNWDRNRDRDRREWDRNNSRYERDRRGDRNDWRGDRRDNDRWDRNSWRNDRRYDWNRYRSNNRRVFQLGSYYAPYRNYSYRRLGIGLSLDSLFFGNRYWISDPYQYRLPEVYGSYRWVRYYDDVLLVDTYSGQVVDVIYDFFW